MKGKKARASPGIESCNAGHCDILFLKMSFKQEPSLLGHMLGMPSSVRMMVCCTDRILPLHL